MSDHSLVSSVRHLKLVSSYQLRGMHVLGKSESESVERTRHTHGMLIFTLLGYVGTPRNGRHSSPAMLHSKSPRVVVYYQYTTCGEGNRTSKIGYTLSQNTSSRHKLVVRIVIAQSSSKATTCIIPRPAGIRKHHGQQYQYSYNRQVNVNSNEYGNKREI